LQALPEMKGAGIISQNNLPNKTKASSPQAIAAKMSVLFSAPQNQLNSLVILAMSHYCDASLVYGGTSV
jgi:hypothetical protein